MAEPPVFQRLALIGVGLIGSSIARIVRREGIAAEIVGADASPKARAEIEELKLCDRVHADAAKAVEGADLVVICTPLGAYAEIGQAIQERLEPGAILSDVGSVKQAVIRDLAPTVPDGVHFIPGHPVAGTEHSGPRAGFAELFQGRWCILTPPPGTDEAAVERLAALWRRAGSMVELMEPAHHDQVLAITSHLPHLIAYTIVGTAFGL
ncbi:MAG TPA: prephenate dehydrogenase/arogenate dehydrogenase family protein, partial [Alphaproteobacteria bacterium]